MFVYVYTALWVPPHHTDVLQADCFVISLVVIDQKMHNRKKSESARTAEQDAIVDRKKIGYISLSAQVLERRAAGDFSAEALALTEQLIRVNPDFYSVWNYRREILLSVHSISGLTECQMPEKLHSDIMTAVRDTELGLSNAGIKKNSKSYGAWHHRQWILNRIQADVDSELELCQQYLKADQRNFHCWNYRRFLAAIGGVSREREIEFSTFKIEENFSNYSAFHHRSVYIRQQLVPVAELIEQEMTIVENAIFTDPFDQSAFWYYQVPISVISICMLLIIGVCLYIYIVLIAMGI